MGPPAAGVPPTFKGQGQGQAQRQGAELPAWEAGHGLQGDTGALSPSGRLLWVSQKACPGSSPHGPGSAASSARFPLLAFPLRPPPAQASLVSSMPMVLSWPFLRSAGISHCGRLSPSTPPSRQEAHSYLFCQMPWGGLAAPGWDPAAQGALHLPSPVTLQRPSLDVFCI